MWMAETLMQTHLFWFWKFQTFSTQLIAYPYSTRGIYITGVVNGCRIHWWSQQSAKEEWGCTGVRFGGYNSKVTSAYWTGNRDTPVPEWESGGGTEGWRDDATLIYCFYLDSRIIHFVFGKVCQPFLLGKGAQAYSSITVSTRLIPPCMGDFLYGEQTLVNTPAITTQQKNTVEGLHLFSRQVAKRRNKIPSFIIIVEHTQCVKFWTLDLTVHRKSEKKNISSAILLYLFSPIFPHTFLF
jgi:hypothetical protein